MVIRTTRLAKGPKPMSIDSLGLPVKNEKQKGSPMKIIECIDDDVDQMKIDMSKVRQDMNEKGNSVAGHDLNDQQLFHIDKQHSSVLQTFLPTIQKFDGCGDAELWLKHMLEKFDAFKLTSIERNNLIPEILTGDAIIWYVKQQDSIPTFVVFMKTFLQYYGLKEVNQEVAPSFTSPPTQVKTQGTLEDKDMVMYSLRNQMLINNLEKLPKFTGKTKQDVYKWLRQIQQAMHLCKLTDEEKLFFVSSCLEAEARDWFFDNAHLFLTWTGFIQKLIKTFESPVKDAISFNRLRHYEQGINQDVRQYYFEIMKLCKEANPIMDGDSKLQYLKGCLKPSLRFDILLKDPKTPEEFLEYAQKVEKLKSLDEEQDIIDWSAENNSTFSSTLNQKTKNSTTQQLNPLMSITPEGYNNTYCENNYPNNESSQQMATTTSARGYYNFGIRKPPYRCYKCGGFDHFIRKCPHFQWRNRGTMRMISVNQ